ncbi:Uncharacterised protein [Candidatus Tiddalikarchaeum anstoanum]|nr:Uncharacterised protein [Candidatus Tiddalikarchaeum anstoanum]
MEVLKGKGLSVKTKKGVIGLDYAGKDCDIAFLSHAHSDHLFKTKNKVLCSDETDELVKIKGLNLNRAILPENMKMVDSGHILGSKSLVIDEDGQKLVFTGDFSLKNKGFNKSFTPIPCNTLIIESTFGMPKFVFPNFDDEMKRAKDWVDDNTKKGYLSVLCGYALGKNQSVQNYFRDYNSSIHDSVKNYNKVYEKYGVKLPSHNELKKSDLLFAPLMSKKNEYFQELSRERKIKSAVFSGWNIFDDYKYRFGADSGFTISDHADFKELLTTVKLSSPKKIFVHHGFSEQFTNFLRFEGYDVEEI